jgi:hypothetical protein
MISRLKNQKATPAPTSHAKANWGCSGTVVRQFATTKLGLEKKKKAGENVTSKAQLAKLKSRIGDHLLYIDFRIAFFPGRN